MNFKLVKQYILSYWITVSRQIDDRQYWMQCYGQTFARFRRIVY